MLHYYSLFYLRCKSFAGLRTNLRNSLDSAIFLDMFAVLPFGNECGDFILPLDCKLVFFMLSSQL